MRLITIRLYSSILIAVAFAVGLSTHTNADDLDEAVKSFEAGNYEEALKSAKAAQKSSPKVFGPNFYLGRTYFELENFDEAEDYLEEAAKIEPKNPDAHMWLGRTYGEKARLSNMVVKGLIAPKIRKAFEKAVELRPDSIESRDDLIQFYIEAPGFLGGSAEKAMEQANAIAKLDAKAGVKARGRVYSDTDQPDKAYDTYRQAIKDYPDERDFYFQAGYMAAAAGDFDDAFEIFEALVEHNPDAIGGLYQVARMAAMSGKNLERGEEAMKTYMTHDVREGHPSHDNALWRLGLIYEHMNKPADARIAYQRALKMNPDNEEVQKALKELG